MADLLDMAKINTLPHPLYIRLYGDKIVWPLESVDVETGLLRFDVCGMLQVGQFGDVAEIVDGDGERHQSNVFYLEDDTSAALAPAPKEDGK